MYLARIQPEKPNYDRQTFECPQCDLVHIEIVRDAT